MWTPGAAGPRPCPAAARQGPGGRLPKAVLPLALTPQKVCCTLAAARGLCSAAPGCAWTATDWVHLSMHGTVWSQPVTNPDPDRWPCAEHLGRRPAARTVPSSLDHSPLPRSYQASTASPGLSWKGRSGMAARPMSSLLTSASFAPLSTFSCTSSCARWPTSQEGYQGIRVRVRQQVAHALWRRPRPPTGRAGARLDVEQVAVEHLHAQRLRLGLLHEHVQVLVPLGRQRVLLHALRAPRQTVKLDRGRL